MLADKDLLEATEKVKRLTNMSYKLQAELEEKYKKLRQIEEELLKLDSTCPINREKDEPIPQDYINRLEEEIQNSVKEISDRLQAANI